MERSESKAKLSSTGRDLLGLGEKDKRFLASLFILFFLHLR